MGEESDMERNTHFEMEFTDQDRELFEERAAAADLPDLLERAERCENRTWLVIELDEGGDTAITVPTGFLLDVEPVQIVQFAARTELALWPGMVRDVGLLCAVYLKVAALTEKRVGNHDLERVMEAVDESPPLNPDESDYVEYDDFPDGVFPKERYDDAPCKPQPTQPADAEALASANMLAGQFGTAELLDDAIWWNPQLLRLKRIDELRQMLGLDPL
ncbi:MAG: hypothetical protein ABEJ24_05810 [Candidatus Magasanikbacteria bacterium]